MDRYKEAWKEELLNLASSKKAPEPTNLNKEQMTDQDIRLSHLLHGLAGLQDVTVCLIVLYVVCFFHNDTWRCQVLL